MVANVIRLLTLARFLANLLLIIDWEALGGLFSADKCVGEAHGTVGKGEGLVVGGGILAGLAGTLMERGKVEGEQGAFGVVCFEAVGQEFCSGVTGFGDNVFKVVLTN